MIGSPSPLPHSTTRPERTFYERSIRASCALGALATLVTAVYAGPVPAAVYALSVAWMLVNLWIWAGIAARDTRAAALVGDGNCRNRQGSVARGSGRIGGGDGGGEGFRPGAGFLAWL